MLVIAAVLLIALALSAYTVRTITADNRLPSQEFLASFATPDWKDGSSWTLAQNVGQQRDSVDLDWAQVVEDSLTHSRHGVYVPTGAEFDAACAAASGTDTPIYDRLLAAMGLDEVQILGPVDIAAMVDANAPAKPRKVRVYDLARDCGVDSKFMRTVLDHQFGIATKSPSSTVTDAQARSVVEFFATHADA